MLNDAPDASPPCHADLCHLQERIQKIGEVANTIDKTIRIKCGDLHSKIVETLQHLERNLAFMSRKKLIKVVAEFSTALNTVEEDFCHWAKYNHLMTLFRANDMCRSIDHHVSRCLKVLCIILECAVKEEYVPDPKPDSLYNQGMMEAAERGIKHLMKLQKALNATPLLEPDSNIFDDPTDPGVQIMALRLSPDFEVIPPTEMDAEVEKSPFHSTPMCQCGDFFIWKMVWAKRCYVAAKTYKQQPWRAEETPIPRLKRNADVWRSMKHPNILPLLGICTFVHSGNPHVYFISPWMKNGNVNSYLRSNPGADRVQLIHDVALGVRYLHEIGVVHRNLKGGNVLVNLDGTAVISGFSGSKILGPDHKLSVSCGIPVYEGRWTPPESELIWGKEADIWTWSMTAIEILSGDWPFKNVQNWAIEQSARVWFEGFRPSPEDYLPQHIASSGVWELLNKCWKHQPEERVIIDEVVTDLEAERRTGGWDPGAPTVAPKRDWDIPMSF